MNQNFFEEMELQQLRDRAEELGISLQEYMLLRLLMKLDDLKVTAHVAE